MGMVDNVTTDYSNGSPVLLYKQISMLHFNFCNFKMVIATTKSKSSSPDGIKISVNLLVGQYFKDKRWTNTITDSQARSLRWQEVNLEIASVPCAHGNRNMPTSHLATSCNTEVFVLFPRHSLHLADKPMPLLPSFHIPLLYKPAQNNNNNNNKKNNNLISLPPVGLVVQSVAGQNVQEQCIYDIFWMMYVFHADAITDFLPMYLNMFVMSFGQSRIRAGCYI